jgi:hypothetical protein
MYTSLGEVEDYTISFTGGSKTIAVDNQFDLQVYPVPAQDLLNIKINGNELPFEIRIFDSMGKLMETFALEAGKSQLNLTSYPVGLYYMKAGSQSQVIVRKFVKQ